MYIFIKCIFATFHVQYTPQSVATRCVIRDQNVSGSPLAWVVSVCTCVSGALNIPLGV